MHFLLPPLTFLVEINKCPYGVIKISPVKAVNGMILFFYKNFYFLYKFKESVNVHSSDRDLTQITQTFRMSVRIKFECAIVNRIRMLSYLLAILQES